MDLIVGRLAGSPPPDRDELESALQRQTWLTHRPQDPLTPRGTFVFPGGGVHVSTAPLSEGPYAAPWLYVWLTEAYNFREIAPRLLRLAGDLGLGICTTLSPDRWWAAPTPSADDHHWLDRAVAASASCDGHEAWLLLGFTLADRACLELAESSPALAALVASTNWFGSRPGNATAQRQAFLRDLARRPRHEILGATGGRATRSMARMLARVVPERIDVEALRLLTRGGVPSTAEDLLRHLPRFRCGTVHLVADPALWPHVGARLLREAAEDPDEHAVSILLRDTLDMAERLGTPLVGRVASLARLVEIHDSLRREFDARPPEELQARDREEPVAPRRAAPPDGTATIVRLRTVEELRQEGAEMQHCVASYDRRVLRGDCFVYRVLEPERATLSLRVARSGDRWEIEQVRGRENRAVQGTTERALREWLARAGRP